MASNIDPTCAGQLTTRGLNVQKSEVQEQLQAAKDEIDALQQEPKYLSVTGAKTLVGSDWGDATTLWVAWNASTSTFEEVIDLPAPSALAAGKRAIFHISTTSSTRLTVKDNSGNYLWAGQYLSASRKGHDMLMVAVNDDATGWEIIFGRAYAYDVEVGAGKETTTWTEAVTRLNEVLRGFDVRDAQLILYEDITVDLFSGINTILPHQRVTITGNASFTRKLILPMTGGAAQAFDISGLAGGIVQLRDIHFDFTGSTTDPNEAITFDNLDRVELTDCLITDVAAAPNNTVFAFTNVGEVDFGGTQSWSIATDGVTPALSFVHCPYIYINNIFSLTRGGAADAGHGIYLNNSHMFVSASLMTVSDFTVGIDLTHNATFYRVQGTVTISSNTTGVQAKYGSIANAVGVTFSGNTADASPVVNTVGNANSFIATTAV
jgi:hypothetical protein